jgi:methylamine dehydrogenase light chain
VTSASSLGTVLEWYDFANDARDYVIAYNDCCGNLSCGSRTSNRNEKEMPLDRASRNNGLNWCMAIKNAHHHCSVSVVLGVAEK